MRKIHRRKSSFKLRKAHEFNIGGKAVPICYTCENERPPQMKTLCSRLDKIALQEDCLVERADCAAIGVSGLWMGSGAEPV